MDQLLPLIALVTRCNGCIEAYNLGEAFQNTHWTSWIYLGITLQLKSYLLFNMLKRWIYPYTHAYITIHVSLLVALQPHSLSWQLQFPVNSYQRTSGGCYDNPMTFPLNPLC